MARRPRTSRTARLSGAVALNPPTISIPVTPLSSIYSSAYAPEAEWHRENEMAVACLSVDKANPETNVAAVGALEAQEPARRRVFWFLELPTELRLQIYKYHFDGPGGRVVDLEPSNHKRIHKKLGILRTCRTVYHEATHFLYSTSCFRIFPCHPGRFFKTKKPLLSRLTTYQRSFITSLELRLGPGWKAPPRGWVVNAALGLSECINVRRLTVFVECDPSDGVFNGFRRADGFYEAFSRDLLRDVLTKMPFVEQVTFDAWSSVKKSGGMMQALLKTTAGAQRKICWGPERGWTDQSGDDDEEFAKMDSQAATATALLNGVGMNVVVVV